MVLLKLAAIVVLFRFGLWQWQSALRFRTVFIVGLPMLVPVVMLLAALGVLPGEASPGQAAGMMFAAYLLGLFCLFFPFPKAPPPRSK